MILMTDFQRIYNALSNQPVGNQKKVHVDSCLEVFFGYSFDGMLRLSFMSKQVPQRIESTKILHVVQGCENGDSFWTSFDLLDITLKDAYFSFCENMLDSVTGASDEQTALALLTRRFKTWKTLFQKNQCSDIPREKLLGVLGELVTLKEQIAPQYGMKTTVQSWGGPDMQSKDFTVGNTWYEVKTIGANTDRVHISSLTQLSSNLPGHLVVVRAEGVSPEYKGKSISVMDLIKEILLIISDEATENLFVKKLQDIGIDIYGTELTERFEIKSVTRYLVDDGFPRITEKGVNHSEIVSVDYSISLSAISRFTEV